MKDQNILHLGKFVFWLFFLTGNICFFGYMITREFWFADSGFVLVTYGTVFNVIILFLLLGYGTIEKAKRKVCFQSAGILLINIPFAVLYTISGWNMVFK